MTSFGTPHEAPQAPKPSLPSKLGTKGKPGCLGGSILPIYILDGGFEYFSCSPLPGKIIQFDEYFSDGLKPPTSLPFIRNHDMKIPMIEKQYDIECNECFQMLRYSQNYRPPFFKTEVQWEGLSGNRRDS